MITDRWFIQDIDHRISTALIFILLLLLIGEKRNKRALFPLRVLVSLTVMCTVSWAIRTIVDEYLFSSVAQGLGHSIYLLVMSMLYMCAHALCYHATPVRLIFADLLALTVFKLAWNTFKVCASVGTMMGAAPLWSSYSIAGSLVSYVVYAAVCIPACWLFRRIVRQLPDDPRSKSMVQALGAFMGCQIVLEFCGRVFTADSSALFLYYLCALLYTITNYVVILAVTQLSFYRRDNEDMHRFIANKMQYYQMSREGILSLQIKCHDLKHQIALIRSKAGKASFEKYIDRLEDSIIEYGTVVECGSEPINVVLTEKNILCQSCGVKFSYIIDGTLFAFLTEMEIYSLFGNALDNALESCSKVEDPEMRMISLKAVQRGEMVVLHVENSFAEEPVLVGGMPVTRKGSGHGFGLRSIQQIAEKYGGAASVQVGGSIFKLTVFMRPQSRTES